MANIKGEESVKTLPDDIEKVQLEGIQLQEVSKRTKCVVSKKRVLFSALILVAAFSLVIILAVVLTRNHNSDVDEYKETRYVLRVKTEVTSIVKEKLSTTSDDFLIIIFALDMKGSNYELMIVNGALEEENPKENSVDDTPESIFMSFQISRGGEILQTKYFKESISDEIASMLSGVVQAFVVDQDSKEEYSECKFIKNSFKKCTKNKLVRAKNYLHYKKSANQDDYQLEDGEIFDSEIETIVNKHKKVEKSYVRAKFKKTISNFSRKESMDFDMNADIIVVSRDKLNRDEIKTLNEINQKLPKIDIEDNNKKSNARSLEEDYIIDHENNEQVHESSKLNNHNSTERSLQSQHIVELNKYEDVPFNLIFEVIPLNPPFCVSYSYTFGDFITKLLSDMLCVGTSSQYNGVKNTKGYSKKYLKQFTYFLLFTFELYSEVNVANNLILTRNNYEASITSYISYSVTGSISLGLARGGVSYIKKINLNLVQISTNLILLNDRSTEGSYSVLVQVPGIGWKCTKIFGKRICVPWPEWIDFNGSIKEPYSYTKYPNKAIYP